MAPFEKSLVMPSVEEALSGRHEPMRVTNVHAVLGNPILPPFAEHLQQALFGLGCFWGLSGASGSCRVSMPQRWATAEALPPIPPMKKFARAVQPITKWFSWYLIPLR